MKMNKEERDSFVQGNHQTCSIKEMAERTGWSMTTIKSVKRRLGLVENSKIKNFLEDNPDLSYKEVSLVLGAKIDNVRDYAKSIGRTDVTYADRGFRRLATEFDGKFIIRREDYKDNKTRVPLECVSCGNVTGGRPLSMLQVGKFCEFCEPSDSRDAYLYILELQETMTEEEIGQFKVGVSSNVKGRIHTIKHRGKLRHLEVVDLVKCTSMSEARLYERLIHKKLKNFQVYGDHKIFDGSTEIFETSLDNIYSKVSEVFST